MVKDIQRPVVPEGLGAGSPAMEVRMECFREWGFVFPGARRTAQWGRSGSNLSPLTGCQGKCD